jgi:hypothetical protein
MSLVVANVGECELLDKALKDALSVDESYTLKLFQSDTTPSASSTAASFTEADFTNYVAKTLTRAGWGAAATVDGKASSTYSVTQTWTCGASGNTIYGYYLIGSTSTTLLWAERFAVARTLTENDTLSITPIFTLDSEV